MQSISSCIYLEKYMPLVCCCTGRNFILQIINCEKERIQECDVPPGIMPAVNCALDSRASATDLVRAMHPSHTIF